jgi:putative ABC transport system permease protein
LKQPGISNVTWASVNIINYSGQTGDNSWDGKENGETLMLSPMNVDKDFIPFFKMQLVQDQASPERLPIPCISF